MFDVGAGGAVSALGCVPETLCSVCGDIAAGFHCGAYVCEACKVGCSTLACFLFVLGSGQRRCKKRMQKHVQKHMHTTRATIFFASNCDKPLVTKFVRRKILHEIVIRLQNVAIGPYHSFMQNFTSRKFCDKRFITVWCQNVFLHAFCTCFCMRFLHRLTAALCTCIVLHQKSNLAILQYRY